MTGHFLFVHINEWANVESPDAIPVSQGYILAALQQQGFSGRILGDYQDRPLEPYLFKKCMQQLQPAALGFSVYEENINRVRVWARFAKSIDPEVVIVLGGPQITFMPGEALFQMREADILCRGDGETVFLEIARALEGNRNWYEIPGISFRDNNTIVETGPCPGPDNLDALPSPYLEKTLDPAGKSRVILLTSRGCTSPCTFCYTTRASNKTVRFHSVERVIAEMQFLHDRGIEDFWFADPNFAYSRQRLESLLHAIIEQVPGITFWCQTRYNLIDRELLALLRRAGAHTIAFGLETASTESLKRIKKGLDLEKMSQAIRLTQESGINVELFSLFGLPGETRQQAEQTLHFVKEHNVAIEGNSISQQLHLFFGTPINDDPEAHGIKPLPITKPSYQSICRDFRTDGMTSDEIRKMSLQWRLSRQDFQDDVTRGENLFTIAGYITRHRKLLNGSPTADMLLARIYMELDEFRAASECLRRLQNNFSGNMEAEDFLAGPFIAYTNKRRGVARTGCRIIFDCKGFLDGEAVPETECYYKVATLGNGTLVEDFEQGIIGNKAGSAFQFDVVFPEDYGHQPLAGKKVVFQAFLYQVMEPVVFPDLAALNANPPRNMYRINDLVNLKKYNENLYYMVLRDSVLHSYSGSLLADQMALFNYNLKLGFKEKALDIAYSLPEEPSVRGHAGRVMLANGLPEEAREFLEQAAGTSAEMENQRIKAHIALKEYEAAERIASQGILSPSLQTMHLKVKLASLRRLPVGTYLDRLDRLLDSQVKMMAANMPENPS